MAIKGIGVDVVRVSRMEELVQRWGERFLNRVFTADELDYSLKRKRAYEHLSARFAAKEAYIKASGVRASWKEIEVSSSGFARPCFSQLPDEADPAKVHLSLSHIEQEAITAVLIEE